MKEQRLTTRLGAARFEGETEGEAEEEVKEVQADDRKLVPIINTFLGYTQPSCPHRKALGRKALHEEFKVLAEHQPSCSLSTIVRGMKNVRSTRKEWSNGNEADCRLSYEWWYKDKEDKEDNKEKFLTIRAHYRVSEVWGCGGQRVRVNGKVVVDADAEDEFRVNPSVVEIPHYHAILPAVVWLCRYWRV